MRSVLAAFEVFGGEPRVSANSGNQDNKRTSNPTQSQYVIVEIQRTIQSGKCGKIPFFKSAAS